MKTSLASEKLIERFDNYFPEREKSQDLREYIEKYFKLVYGGRDLGGYVPRIFVFYSKKSERYVTLAVVMLNNPTLIPPVDMVGFVEIISLSRMVFSPQGLLKMHDFLKLLSPYLEKIDAYPYLRLLPFHHRSSQAVVNRIKNSPKLQDFDKEELMPVDVIPSMKEELEIIDALVPCLISSVPAFGNLSCHQITGTT
jgi:hypothetical protein